MVSLFSFLYAPSESVCAAARLALYLCSYVVGPCFHSLSLLLFSLLYIFCTKSTIFLPPSRTLLVCLVFFYFHLSELCCAVETKVVVALLPSSFSLLLTGPAPIMLYYAPKAKSVGINRKRNNDLQAFIFGSRLAIVCIYLNVI